LIINFADMMKKFAENFTAYCYQLPYYVELTYM